MSDKTGDGNQPPDPDQKKDQGQGQSQSPGQDQTSGSDFNDPTAPVWLNETAPLSPPPPPPAPPGAAQASNQQRTAVPPSAPSMGNPYASPPPAPPYGQPTAQYGQPTDQYGQPTDQYGQPQPGSQQAAYGQQPYGGGPPTEANVSAIILTVLSALSLCTLLAVVPLVLGIVALTKNATDRQGSRRLTKIGWITFVGAWVLFILFVVGLALLNSMSDGRGSPRMFNAGY